ncbi:MAG TPA: thiamine pyrophosphate-dependent dehydrogenase E1 component subunit alpha [Anaerolineae bacterium]|nr:thiamine pyrophosphate-dependent dehydrogenase E1 component subunit alpha [Anaerolineae bacterium]
MELSKEKLLTMYQDMLTIRRFEEMVFETYRNGQIRGIAHLYIGEEAVAVGACSVLRRDDYITSTHRGHGHCIAKGGDVNLMMAELMGKRTGYSKGKGGSMHIFDREAGILGANGIVGGGIGMAVGAALAIKKRKTDQVVVAFFGDGGANQGVLYEGMNLAGVWSLPVIFLCENNHFGEFTPYRTVTSGESIALRSTGFGFPGVRADGNDVCDVAETVGQAVERARQGQGPTLIECVTYRYFGHHSGDPGVRYRSKEEIEQWKSRDPIESLGRTLMENWDVSADEFERIDEKVTNKIKEAVEFGLESPLPDPNEVTADVYA